MATNKAPAPKGSLRTSLGAGDSGGREGGSAHTLGLDGAVRRRELEAEGHQRYNEANELVKNVVHNLLKKANPQIDIYAISPKRIVDVKVVRRSASKNGRSGIF